MNLVVVLTEEPSCARIVKALCQRLKLDAERVKVLSHQGKSDLKRSFPRKIKAWNTHSHPRFIVLHDQDVEDCKILKDDLLALVPEERRDVTRIRIVCRELESWYLGDFDALHESELLSPKDAEKYRHKAKFRNPDAIVSAKREFEKLHCERGAIGLAERIGPYLNPRRSRSSSFRLFARTLQEWAYDRA